jgi:hypothetical protein
MEVTIKLADFKTTPEARVFSGRPRGEHLRGVIGLSEMDRNGDTVKVVIPADTYILNMSFFLGMFSDSVRFYSGVDKFFEHYQFEGPPVHLRKLLTYAEEALREGNALEQKKTA